jgi:pimeloyl-ACP methyl ester carboxylesterase
MSYADVNGLSLYYEERGDGEATPLVMLHGGFGTGDMFGRC